MTLLPGPLNLACYADDPWEQELVVYAGTAVENLTGTTWAAHMRDIPGGAIVGMITVAVTNPTGGVLRLSLTAAQTKAIATAGGSLVWDLQRIGGSTLLVGTISSSIDVTVP